MTSPHAVALHVSRRLFAREGETRINLLRVLTVALFYVVHLVNRFGVGMSTGAVVEVPGTGIVLAVFDTTATALTIAWAAMGGAVLLIVRSNLLQRLVGPVTTVVDVAFLTILLLIGNGPSSPMTAALFLLVSGAGLRGRRELVWVATAGSLVSYALTIAFAAVVRPALMPPTYHILVMTTALTMAGVVTDLTVGAFWRAIGTHADTLRRVVESGGPELTVPPRQDTCPWCGDSNLSDASTCIRCEQPLAPGVPFRTTELPSALQAGRVHVGWALSVAGLVLVAVALGVGLAVDWPALLVPYLGAAVLLFLALGRLLQLDLRMDEHDKAIGKTVSTLGTAAATLALGATTLMLMIGIMVLAVVGTGVIAFALCCAVVMGAAG